MTKENKRIVRTGIVFIIIIAMTIWGINFIRSNDLISSKTVFYGVYDNVKELSAGNHVFIKGTKVGKVVKVDFLDEDLNKLIVEFHIRKDLKIPDSTVAVIKSTDLMGTMGLDLILNKTSQNYHVSGDTLYSSVERSLSEEVNKQILPLKLKTEAMLGTLDSLLIAFRSVFNPDTRSNIKQSFEDIRLTLENLEGASSTIDTLLSAEKNRISTIIRNAELISENLKNNNDKINNIFGNLNKISDTLRAANFTQVINQADSAIHQVSRIANKINKGEGTLGLLIEDDELYDKLNKASDNLDKLIKDIKANPKRYLRFSAFNFGRKVYVNESDSANYGE
jgi:phospholipid/cholesterol/gamma-HCH transport system substrate-binding protein